MIMPTTTTATTNEHWHSRLTNVAAALSAVLDTLKVLSDNFKTPFLLPIASTGQALVGLSATIKQNKAEHLVLLEQTGEVLQAIVVLHLKTEGGGVEIPPSMLHHLGDFATTLHKIHHFLETQQDGGAGKIKRFFRQGEMTALLKQCREGLQRAKEAFMIQAAETQRDVAEMVASAEESHREVMQLIEVLSDSTLSETTSSIHRVLPGEDNSNSSVSLFLPSQPQIFHGREIEVKSIISQLSSPESLRIAILGPGGIGKSSLARVVLHHPVVVEKYGGSRFFVPCDSASSTAELASLVAAYIGLEAGSTKNAAVQVVQHLNKLPGHVLLVLDNLETVWELDDKKGTEDFLAGLAGLGHLGLMITMRGAERPAQVLWTRPFLQPLQPLSTPAAVQTFSEIADVDDVPPTDLDAVLRLTDNVPLAINLIAHLVDVEGIAAVLARWNTEGTGVVSEGWDKRTNLDRSIALSLTSPRLLGTPGAMELLSLLALLPDGLTNADLTESRLPLPEGGKILDCKSTLLRTSLAYITTHKRLKVLAPIREHLQAYHPASSMTVNALFASYYQLVELFKQYQGTLRNANTIPQIAESFANIQNTISFRIRERIGGRLDDAGRRDTVYCALHLNAWSHMAGNGALRVMRDIKGILASPVDHHLEVSFIAEFLFAQRNFVGEDMETLINKAVGHFEYFDDSNVKCRFYNAVGDYFGVQSQPSKAADWYEKALTLAIETGNTERQSEAHRYIAWNRWTRGDYHAGHKHAREAQRTARLRANLHQEAIALYTEVMCLGQLGAYPESIVQAERAGRLLSMCGMSGGELETALWTCLGEIHTCKSEYVEARAVQFKTLETFTVEKQPIGHAIAMLNIAKLDIALGEAAERVEGRITAAREAAKVLGQMGTALCDATYADLELREGNVVEAREVLLRLLQWSLGKSNEMAMHCLDRLADGTRWDATHSSTWPFVFLGQAMKSRQRRESLRALQYVGEVMMEEEDSETAQTLLAVAFDGFTSMDIHESRGDCLLKLGDLAYGRGEGGKAVECWAEAVILFERCLQTKKATAARTKLEDAMDENR